MPSYWVYLLDGIGGRTSAADHDCIDDAAATKLGPVLN